LFKIRKPPADIIYIYSLILQENDPHVFQVTRSSSKDFVDDRVLPVSLRKSRSVNKLGLLLLSVE